MLVMYPQSEGTNLGSLMQSFGGVARNIAGKPTQSHFILTLLPSHTPTLSPSSSLLGVGMRLPLLTLSLSLSLSQLRYLAPPHLYNLITSSSFPSLQSV